MTEVKVEELCGRVKVEEFEIDSAGAVMAAFLSAESMLL